MQKRFGTNFPEGKIGAGERPTVLAISILDRTQPHDKRDSHSGLIHFILDGHHKIEAAARIGAEISVLSMLSIDDSLADPEKVRGIPALINSAPVGL